MCSPTGAELSIRFASFREGIEARSLLLLQT
jgi:hypothetical protein